MTKRLLLIALALILTVTACSPKPTGGCTAAEVRTLDKYYREQTDKIVNLVDSFKVDNITGRSLVNRASELALEAKSYQAPACAQAADDEFDRYMLYTAMGIEATLANDIDAARSFAVYCIDARKSFLDEFAKLK